MKTPLASAYSLFKQSLVFYKKHLKTFLFIGLIASLLAVVPALFELVTKTSSSQGITLISALLSFIFSATSFVVSVILPLVFIKTIAELDGGKTVLVNETYKSAFKLFFPCAWVTMLTAAVLMGASVLLLIPGIILTFFLLFPLYAFVLKDERGLKALSSSFYFSKGYGRSLLCKYLFLGLVMCVAVAVVVGIPTLLFFLATANEAFFVGLVNNPAFRSFMNLLSMVGTFVLHTILLPIFYLYFYFIYKNLLAIKPEPNPAIDFARSRTWFIAFLVIAIIFCVGVSTLLITGTL